ncbi:MAG: UDP-4-amino-4,6-dideoxy-N-acetyl-beta-L-altrosamine transaminase [Proteobacteria bacterium]|nr:UDP-4-amino-4,6-dideoxy-N-acetyl-beta-L-altrosamine transaminase [Pseudomonadota bacterium]
MKVPYGKQKIETEDINAVVEVLKSDYLTQGPTVNRFEEAFAKQVGAKHAVAFCNATAALHTSFKILNRGSSKKVIVTPITFAASSNCVLYEGGSLEFVDIDPTSFNLDLNKVEELLAQNPNSYQGIIPVDFAGLPVDTEKLSELAKKYNLWILEDGCHAIGGGFYDSNQRFVPVGSCVYSDITTFSFHPVKHIATGEGGMVTTNDSEVYRRLVKLRSHGMERDPLKLSEPSHGGWYHEMQELGFNYRLSDINAALGLSQLSRLSQNVDSRNLIAKKYQDFCDTVGASTQRFDRAKFKNAHHLFVIQTEKRKDLYDFLREREIFSQVHYLPVYQHPYYRENGFADLNLSCAENYYRHALSLPMFHSMSSEELDFVLTALKEFYLT